MAAYRSSLLRSLKKDVSEKLPQGNWLVAAKVHSDVGFCILQMSIFLSLRSRIRQASDCSPANRERELGLNRLGGHDPRPNSVSDEQYPVLYTVKSIVHYTFGNSTLVDFHLTGDLGSPSAHFGAQITTAPYWSSLVYCILTATRVLECDQYRCCRMGCQGRRRGLFVHGLRP